MAWDTDPLDFSVGGITVGTLSDLKTKVADVRENSGVDHDWIYAPFFRRAPMPAALSGLPKTDSLSRAGADGPGHFDFLVWALSFFVGMRLNTTEAGFLDAMRIKPRALIDFVLSPREYQPALANADAFWRANKAHPIRVRRWIAAVHALFIAHYPQALQFERFINLYGALDACFTLAKDSHPVPKDRVRHDRRLSWMCSLFNMPMPVWHHASAGYLWCLSFATRPCTRSCTWMRR